LSNYGILLLSKVIDTNDPAALARYNIAEEHFNTEPERKAYRFIKEYAEQNRGQSPSYATVTEECPGFFYTPEVGDSYEYLTRKLLNESADAEFTKFINDGRLAQSFEAGRDDMSTFIDELTEQLNAIKLRTDVRSKVGTDLKTDGQAFLDEYVNRKDGKSFRIWKSKFPKINEMVGGYLSGNMYAWGGRSGRGKSVFTMEEIIEAAMQGANVLVWAMEMSRFEWLARAYSSISARQGYVNAEINGVDYNVGFENRALLTGKLSEEFEAGFRTFIAMLDGDDLMPGNITVRSADDTDFIKRDVRQLEADILQTKADVVLVDPIYLMDYEANTSKTSGGDVANTSKKIRRIAGYTNTVIHVVTQAEEVKDDKDDDGNRELRAPRRGEYKKTSSILEDSTYAFGIDSLDGRGLIEQLKGRSGGEGLQVEVLYLPNFGIVREFEVGESAVSDFDF
jgi:replicative DNA helicase